MNCASNIPFYVRVYWFYTIGLISDCWLISSDRERERKKYMEKSRKRIHFDNFKNKLGKLNVADKMCQVSRYSSRTIGNLHCTIHLIFRSWMHARNTCSNWNRCEKNTHTTIPNSILFRYLSFHDNNDFISAFLCLDVYFTFANEILCLTCELIINQ